ncbi:hypothetical protein SH601_14385 [Gracilibacillus sp. S3-1-1]|uniref:Uncharacterized protein n=1 Tax=Gracilibacillus pellucidus TaxID=3095368 RepID=A0ACC6M8G4_9BACI|nr:hypothetical protein [Gracilibacillus sp. S3-1-1]MDX8047176.1 hypothetical protein [Gracilibacillus sp. S3-1-1]
MENRDTQDLEQSEQIEDTVEQGTDETLPVAKEEKKSAMNAAFKKSVKETQSILLDSILRPHAVISSNRAISMQTSGLILVVLSLLIGICTFLFYRFGFEGLLSYFSTVSFTLIFSTALSWIITFAVGYFSLYLFLLYAGNKKMEHKQLLTHYAIVNIPFAIIFCLVTLFFGFLLVDLFVLTYLFSIMLYGVLHIYLFMVHMEKPKFDLYWTIAAYLLILIAATYLLNGFDMTNF